MKHNIKKLHDDANDVVERYRALDKREQESWWANTRDSWIALRDMITVSMDEGRVITRADVKASAGLTDLDRWYSNEGGDAQVYRSPLDKVARLRQTRPRQHVDISFDQIVAFRDLLATLPGTEVSDQELTDLGFSRFAAVISRLKVTRDEILDIVQEIY